jgi:hypothetical protein
MPSSRALVAFYASRGEPPYDRGMIELVRSRRRNALRRGYNVPCQAVRMRGFRLVGGQLLDVSHRGALLDCNGAVSLGDELIVSFEAPTRDGGGRIVVDATAEVRRIRRTAEGARVGLAFVDMAWDDRAALYVGLSRVPPRVPVQRPFVDYAATVLRIASA